VGRALAAHYKVSEAASLSVGLRALAEAPVSVILLDLVYGEPEPSSSAQTIARIGEFSARAPVIVLTGLDIEEVIEPAILAGADVVYDKLLAIHAPEILLRECRYAELRGRRLFPR
jgi:DNA-binding NarL/FixJ family response regulator